MEEEDSLGFEIADRAENRRLEERVPSVNNVLRHLQRKSSGYGFGSYSSVTGYAEILSWLVRFSGGRTPTSWCPSPERRSRSSYTLTWIP